MSSLKSFRATFAERDAEMEHFSPITALWSTTRVNFVERKERNEEMISRRPADALFLRSFDSWTSNEALIKVELVKSVQLQKQAKNEKFPVDVHHQIPRMNE